MAIFLAVYIISGLVLIVWLITGHTGFDFLWNGTKTIKPKEDGKQTD